MSKLTWTIRSPGDLLAKAERERQRFRDAHATGGADQVDHAVNCALTLMALRDWTYRAFRQKLDGIPFPHSSGGTPRPASTAAEFGDLVRYLPWRKVPAHVLVFEAIEALANGAKHFELDQKRLLLLDAWTSVESSTVSDQGIRGSGWHLSGGEAEIEINVANDSLRDALVVKIGSPGGIYQGLGVEKLDDGTLRVRADRILSDGIELWRAVLGWLAGKSESDQGMPIKAGEDSKDIGARSHPGRAESDPDNDYAKSSIASATERPFGRSTS